MIDMGAGYVASRLDGLATDGCASQPSTGTNARRALKTMREDVQVGASGGHWGVCLSEGRAFELSAKDGGDAGAAGVYPLAAV